MNKVKVLLAILLVVLATGFASISASANDEDQCLDGEECCDLPEPTPTEEPELPTPPDFPACSSYSENGDWEHYDYGWHQIVGNGLVEGSDDVYTSGDNFVQCFCGIDGNGIQTNWWRTDSILTGWFSENGLVWNLGDYQYLAQNSDYDCSDPEPTPTPTQPPSGGCTDCAKTYECTAETPDEDLELSASSTSASSVMLTWNAADPVTHYTIQYGTSSGNYQYHVDTGNTTSYEVKDLTPGETYYFQVAAANDCAVGHWSNEITPSRGRILAAHTTVDAGFASGMGIVALISGLIAGTFITLSKLTKRSYIFGK